MEETIKIQNLLWIFRVDEHDYRDVVSRFLVGNQYRSRRHLVGTHLFLCYNSIMKVYVSTVVKSDNRILIIQEGKKSCFGKWNVPSGHLEEDENILNGALREVKEETGLDIKLDRLVGVYNNKYENNNSIQFSFLAETDSPKKLTFDHEEILDARWVDLSEVASYDLRDADYIRDVLNRIENSKTFPLDAIVVK